MSSISLENPFFPLVNTFPSGSMYAATITTFPPSSVCSKHIFQPYGRGASVRVWLFQLLCLLSLLSRLLCLLSGICCLLGVVLFLGLLLLLSFCVYEMTTSFTFLFFVKRFLEDLSGTWSNNGFACL